MANIIDSFRDKVGNLIYPKTLTKAVYEEGTNKRLDTTLEENKTDILSAKTTLGNIIMTTAEQTVTGAINELDADIGDKSSLATANKTNLVSAVNEVKQQNDNLESRHMVTDPNGRPLVGNGNISSGIIDANDVTEISPNTGTGFYLYTQNSLNIPPGTSGIIIAAARAGRPIQIAIDYTNAIIYVRSKYDNTLWTRWKKVLNDDTIPWITATLQNGWTDTYASTGAKYFKDALGIVYLSGDIENGTATNNTIISNLPDGYRPRHSIPIPCVKANDGSNFMLSLVENGNLTVFGSSFTTGTIRFNVSFRAYS